MEPVSEKKVVEEWLSLEVDKNGEVAVEIDTEEEENEALARLFVHKPNSASVFTTFELQWYRHELSKEDFRALRVIWDGNKSSFEEAQAIENEQSTLPEEKVKRIRMFARRFPINTHGPLIANRRRQFYTGPFLQDGNHRAVGLALHMLQGGEYVPQTAFVGYPTLTIGWTGELRGYVHRVLGGI